MDRQGQGQQVNIEDRAAFAEAFQERWGDPVDSEGIVNAIALYHSELAGLNEVHNGTNYPTAQASESVEWLDQIRSTAGELLRLLNYYEQCHEKEDIAGTLAAGISFSPWLDVAIKNAGKAPGLEQHQLVELMAEQSRAFVFGANVGTPFMKLLADLADDPDQGMAAHMWAYINGGNAGPLHRSRRPLERLGKPMSFDEIEALCLQMLCARLAKWFASHGANQAKGYTEDLASLLLYHDLPLAKHCPGTAEGDLDRQTLWIKKVISRSHKAMADEKKLMRRARMRWGDEKK